MDGKRVVITGATAGIGKAAATELARRGADLALVARNPHRASATVSEIHDAAPGAEVDVFRADLSDLDDVRTVAAELVDAYDTIDVLVNNAGIDAMEARRTAQGFDEMLATNYLGPFLLTHLMLDPIRAAAPARIVVVGSEAHRFASRLDPERFEDLGQYSGVIASQRAYGRTKLLDLLFAAELARRLDGTGVTVNSLCPGFVATELAREQGAGRFLAPLSMTPLVRTPEQGARMTVRLASDPKLADVTGRFFTSTPGLYILPTVPSMRDPAIARRVYERTCALVGVDALEPAEKR